ncbi:MAG: 3-hydroxyacyl-CoA dehydrogenase family protein, partial [Conexivisphaera sp.]
YPRGIFEYAGSYGVDSTVSALKRLKEVLGLREYEPDPLLVRMLQDGKLGVKSGEGFYAHKAG